MSDALLSVEVIAKMDALGAGLKTATQQITDFVTSGNTALKEFEKTLNGLGVNTSAQGLKVLTAAIAAQKLENDKLTGSILANKAAEDAAKASIQGNTDSLLKQQIATESQKTTAAGLTAQINALRLANMQNKPVVVAAAGSYDEANQKLKEMGKQIRAAADGFKTIDPVLLKTIADYKELNASLKNFDSAMGNNQRRVGDYSGGIADFFASIKANILGTIQPLALFTAALAAARASFDHNVEISDSFVDVQRTAKLSGDEVDNLGEKLKRINTRTNLEGLLDIGFIGGRLGVAKEDLVGFITQVDELAVVLKKEFPGGAEAVATSLGKIISVYKITQREGITLEDALRKTGSALLELSHNGGAPVQYLQDFALGTAGIAQVTKLSLPTLLAYGSVLSKAGIQASTAATGVTRFLSDLSTKREKYFAIAQLADSTLTIEKFTNLINTDAKEALNLFFKGLKAGNPTTTETGDRLKTLSLTAGRVKNTVIALAESQETLFKSTTLINRAYDEGTSVNHNFELANNSLAASFEKIKNGIENYFTSSENGRALASVLNSFTDTRSEGEKLAEAYLSNKHRVEELEAALKPLVDRYDKLTASGNLTKAQQDELRDVTAKIGAILPGVTTKFDQYGNAIAISRDRINELTKAQKELLLAQNRGAINTANDDFVENQRKAAAQVKLLQGLAAQVGQQYGRKTVTNSDVRDNNDYLVILQGRAYASAKAVRDLGGTLTDAQKKVIAYYEALDKVNKPKKENVTVTGVGDNVEGTDLGRTNGVIKAEIKALTAANEKLSHASAEFKANVKKILADKNELKLANGGKVTQPSDPFSGVVKQLQDFQNKSNLITKTGLEKDLQEWDNQYKNIKAVINKLPSGTKKTTAKATLETEYKDGRLAIVQANSKQVEEALKKSRDAIALADLGGAAKEEQAIRDKYADQIKLALGNKDATLAVEKQMGDEISDLRKTNAAKDLSTSAKQIADIAKEYRTHQGEIFQKTITDSPFAAEIDANEEAIQKLKSNYATYKGDYQKFQEDMAKLVKNGTVLTAQDNFNKVLNDSLKQGVTDLISGTADMIGGILSGASGAGDAGAAFLGIIGNIASTLGKAAIGIGITMDAIKQAFKNPFTAIAAGIALVALGGYIKGAVANITKGDSNSGSSGSSGQGAFSGPHYAMGTNYASGGWSLVGEQGPEVMHVPTGSQIIPNHRVMESIAGGNSVQVMIPEVRLSGQDIYVSFKRTERNNKRT